MTVTPTTRVSPRIAFHSFLVERLLSEDHHARSWIALTFTFKQYQKRNDGTWQKLTDLEVSGCLRQLLKRLNKLCYGAAYRRFRKRLYVVTVIEGGNDKHLHVHVLLEIPKHLKGNVNHFLKWIFLEWRKLRWANREWKYSVIPDHLNAGKWLSYMLKQCKTDTDCVDIDNLCI